MVFACSRDAKSMVPRGPRECPLPRLHISGSRSVHTLAVWFASNDTKNRKTTQMGKTVSSSKQGEHTLFSRISIAATSSQSLRSPILVKGRCRLRQHRHCRSPRMAACIEHINKSPSPCDSQYFKVRWGESSEHVSLSRVRKLHNSTHILEN